MADRYAEETQRIGRLLLRLAEWKGVSVRSLERKMGVSTSVFRNALVGRGTLTWRHVLMITDALGIEWSEFYKLAATPEEDAVPGSAPEMPDMEDAPAEASDVELEQRMRRILARMLLGEAGPPDPSKD